MNNVAVIGSGYIGLVVGANFAEFGNKVICADIDAKKIENLKKGILPIYEPGLQELVEKNILKKNIEFTIDVPFAIQSSDIIFIAVNTPTFQNGESDISAVKAVAKEIGKNLNGLKIICIKSTVAIGTHKIVQEIINQNNKNNFEFHVVSTPEFLREGSAIYDFVSPDRIIIGTKSQKAFEILKELYSPINCNPENIIKTDNLSAEAIKYVSNSFLALKVSFINEIANFCDQLGIDVSEVTKGVGLDKRIGSQFLKPGPGFGGSCFPKDIHALLKMAQNNKIELQTIKATIKVNELQKIKVVQKLKKLLNGSLENKIISVFGLAFKGNTDDIRKSPAIDIIHYLKKDGAIVKAFDPKANENMKQEIPDIQYFDDAYQACQNTDAILILTDWNEFKNLDFETISKIVKQSIILDTRNILDIDKLISLGFTVDIIGRSCLSNSAKINLSLANPKQYDIFS